MFHCSAVSLTPMDLIALKKAEDPLASFTEFFTLLRKSAFAFLTTFSVSLHILFQCLVFPLLR